VSKKRKGRKTALTGLQTVQRAGKAGKERARHMAKVRQAISSGRFDLALDLLSALAQELTPEETQLLENCRRKQFENFLAAGKAGPARALLKTMQEASLASDDFPILEIRLLHAEGDFPKILALGVQRLIEGSCDPFTRDALVLVAQKTDLAFPPEMPPPAATALEVLREAPQLLAKGSFGPLSKALLRIPREGPFAPWRIFFKGLVTFYQQQFSVAREAMERCLPHGAVLQNTARDFLYTLDTLQHQVAQVSQESYRRAALLMGFAPSEAQALARIEYLHVNGRSRDAFQQAFDSFQKFPTYDGSTPGVLTDFFRREWDALEVPQKLRFAKIWTQQAATDSFPHPGAAFFANHLLLSFYLQSGEVSLARETSQKLPELFKAAFGADAVGLSRLHRNLARLFQQKEHKDNFYRLIQDGVVEKNLEEAVRHDPDYLEAILALLRRYREQHKTLERDRLLDKTAKRLPNNRDILEEAGLLCMERSRFFKAVKYFGQALHWDPASERLQWLYAEAFVKRGLQLMRQQSLERLQRFCEDYLAKAPPDPANLPFSRQFLESFKALAIWRIESAPNLACAVVCSYPHHPLRRQIVTLAHLAAMALSEDETQALLSALKTTLADADPSHLQFEGPFLLRLLEFHGPHLHHIPAFPDILLRLVRQVRWTEHPVAFLHHARGSLQAQSHNDTLNTAVEIIRQQFLQKPTPPAAFVLQDIQAEIRAPFASTNTAALQNLAQRLDAVHLQAEQEKDRETILAAQQCALDLRFRIAHPATTAFYSDDFDDDPGKDDGTSLDDPGIASSPTRPNSGASREDLLAPRKKARGQVDRDENLITILIPLRHFIENSMREHRLGSPPRDHEFIEFLTNPLKSAFMRRHFSRDLKPVIALDLRMHQSSKGASMESLQEFLGALRPKTNHKFALLLFICLARIHSWSIPNEVNEKELTLTA
jgi:tetratricopeptide (TPR) repeat protein